MDTHGEGPGTPAHEWRGLLHWLRRKTTTSLERFGQEMAAMNASGDARVADAIPLLPSGMLLVRVIGDLHRAPPRRMDEQMLARCAGIADDDLQPLLKAGIAAGYLTQDVYGVLRLTGAGWRLHHWDQVHHCC
jgi:hypothetical protein